MIRRKIICGVCVGLMIALTGCNLGSGTTIIKVPEKVDELINKEC